VNATTHESEREAGGSAGPDGAGHRRIRFISAKISRERGSNILVRVELEHRGETFGAERSGVGLDAVELRLAADETLDAIRASDPEAPAFLLVGAKRLHAFDADVVLVSVAGGADRRPAFIGAVPVRKTLAEAAALAVLNATNRVLENSDAGAS